MKRGLKNTRRHQSLLRHRGLGLPSTIIIVLFGSMLIAAVFELTTRFNFAAIRQRQTYSD